jgi:thymidylate kinase
VRNAYLEIAWNEVERVKVVDASPSLEEVQARIEEILYSTLLQ